MRDYMMKIMSAMESIVNEAERTGVTVEGFQVVPGGSPHQVWIVSADLRIGSLVGKTSRWIPLTKEA